MSNLRTTYQPAHRNRLGTAIVAIVAAAAAVAGEATVAALQDLHAPMMMQTCDLFSPRARVVGMVPVG
jgi:hypothetical protein